MSNVLCVSAISTSRHAQKKPQPVATGWDSVNAVRYIHARALRGGGVGERPAPVTLSRALFYICIELLTLIGSGDNSAPVGGSLESVSKVRSAGNRNLALIGLRDNPIFY